MLATVVIVLVCLVLGCALGFFLGKNQMKPLLAAAKKETETLRSEIEKNKTEAKAQMDERLNELRSYSQESLRSMESKFSALANEVLEAKTKKFQEDSDARLDLVLKPLKDNISQLDRALKDTNEKSASHHTSFQDAMRQLAEQTASIGKEADNLARALKSDTKMQGDWGEMILDSILEKSGLEKGREFTVQENHKTAEGENVRPDVVVKFPDGHCVIIDSKVSLTAFTDYVNALSKPEQDEALKRHLDSVRKHVQELSDQNYPKDVRNAADYVLMFMPSEASYVAAVQADEKLNGWAWDKKIVIVCPNTLVMTLQIVNNIWKSDRQNKNVETIVKQANDLYDKFVGFVDNFNGLQRDLNTLQSHYDDSRNQLVNGRGNLIGRMEKIKDLGLNPKKQIDAKTRDEAAV